MKKVLLVERDTVEAIMAQVVLEHLGFRVKRATRVREIWTDTAFGTPDVMIITVDMTDDDKRNLEMIRAQSDATIPTIAIAAKDTPDIEQSYGLLGFHGYVRKPLILDNLEAVIQELNLVQPRAKS